MYNVAIFAANINIIKPVLQRYVTEIAHFNHWYCMFCATMNMNWSNIAWKKMLLWYGNMNITNYTVYLTFCAAVNWLGCELKLMKYIEWQNFHDVATCISQILIILLYLSHVVCFWTIEWIWLWTWIDQSILNEKCFYAVATYIVHVC